MTTDNGTCAAHFFDTGEVIDGKWILIEKIGEGGMGVVYRSHQLNLKRDVAIKVISAKMLADLDDNPDERERTIARFRREVQTMAQVRHPNVLQIYDYGSLALPDDESTRHVEYIAMEYVPGNTFRYTMSEQGFGDETEMLVDWLNHSFRPVLDGVAAVHGHGIVHRDLKPENILMDGDSPKIVDFGLARSLSLRCVSNSWDVRGTWPYMAPEQFAEFRKAGVPADIYALGKILYEAIEGKLDKNTPPFTPVRLKDPNTPLLESMDRIIRKATAEKPEHRYQTIAELEREIGAAVEIAVLPLSLEASPSAPPPLVRWLWVGIAIAVLSMGGMTVYHIWDWMREKPPATTDGTIVSEDSQAVVEKPNHPVPVERTILGDDGREMRLLAHADDDRRFYADVELVTFHHYLEFLNAVADDLVVVDGVVKQGESILFYLENKVVFRNNRFQLLDADWAPEPVNRVTWLGARAYAAHYDKRLPTYQEWSIIRSRIPAVVQPEESAGGGAVEDRSSSMHMMHMEPSADSDAPGEQSVMPAREWVGLAEGGKTLSRVVVWPVDSGAPTLLKRYPWEGFSDVGFRTVIDAPPKQNRR